MTRQSKSSRDLAARTAGRVAQHQLLAEAERRGHGSESAGAAAGAGLGALVGSFRGPAGAAVGGLLGALVGYAVGASR